ncbi:hypothetical protein [Leptodesmis sp.]|uniref:hypothetical protein n=1 Tax=Leptodesmis sp. TaxID=3100501 RepID=UPI0040535958
MKSVECIEKEIVKLQEAVAALAQEFYETYRDYLDGLGQAVRQQLILASYNVCTQGYPANFLALSLSQQQALQKAIRTLANQTQESLQEILQKPDEWVAVSRASVLMSEGATPGDPVKESDQEQGEPQTTPASGALTPEDVIQWQETLEQEILYALRNASQDGNRLLQQAAILPKQLPEAFLQQVGKAEMVKMGASSPNLLNVLIEDPQKPASSEEDLEDPESLLQIIAIQLRLTDIEFANAALTLLRNKTRSLSARLKKLWQLYRRKSRERAIAQAQQAWQASWFED